MFQWTDITLGAAPAPARTHQLPAGDEYLRHMITLNADLLNEVEILRSELPSFAAHSGAELCRAKALLEAERAEASGSSQLLNLEVKKVNLKAAEVSELKAKLEASILGKEDILGQYNTLKLKCINLEAENDHIMHELKGKEAVIKELSQQLKLEPFQPKENRRGSWTWLIPLTTVIVVAGALIYELKNLRPQLYSATDYCEKSYLYNEQKQI